MAACTRAVSRSLLVGVALLMLATHAAATPVTTSSLALWLDASNTASLNGGTITDGAAVSAWDDVLAGDNTVAQDAVQATAARRPVWVQSVAGLNGKSAVRFDGSPTAGQGDRLGLDAALPLGIDATAFVVALNQAQGDDGGSCCRPFFSENTSNYNGAGYGLGLTRPSQGSDLTVYKCEAGYWKDIGAPDDQFHIFAFSSNSATTKLIDNGAVVATPALTNTPTGTGYTIGGNVNNNARHYLGDIGEIIIYNAELSDFERGAVGVYLQDKYGIAGSFANDAILTTAGNWGTGGNWDSGFEPLATTHAYAGGGLTATISATGEVARDLTVGHNQATSPGDGTVSQTGGDLTVTHDVTLGQTGRAGTLAMTGGTATVNGSLTDGGGTSTLHVDDGTMNVGGALTVDTLRVGYNTGDAVVSAGGAVSIGASGILTIGLCDIMTTTNTTGVLDLSAASSVAIDVDQLRMGILDLYGSQNNVGGTLKLSLTGTNTVNAQTILMGTTVHHFNYQTVDQIMELGGAANTFNVNNFTIGGLKSDAKVTIAPGGTLGLTGLTSAGDKANLFVSDNNTGTGAAVSSSLDLSDATFNATLGQLVIGRFGSVSGYSRGTLVMDAGTVTADSVDLAWITGSATTPSNTWGTLTMNGGTLAVAGNVDEGTGNGGGVSTLHVNDGTMTIGGNLVVDTLRVGYDTGNATVTAGGTVRIGATGTNTSVLDIGRRDIVSSSHTYGELDLSAATSVELNLDSLRLGFLNNSSGTGECQGILRLSQAGNNTVNANAIIMGTTLVPYNFGSVDQLMTLGGAQNDFNVSSFTVGRLKSDATVTIAPGGTLTLKSLTGGKANLFIGDNNTGTGATVSSSLDLSDATFNATLGQLVIGRFMTASGYSRGTLVMDAGMVTADSVDLAWVTGAASTPANTHGTLTMNGGTLTVAGNVDEGTGNGAGVSTLHVDGGTMTIGGDLLVDHLRVGYNMHEGKVTAGGTVAIGASGDLDIGVRDANSGTITKGELDLSAASSVTMNLDKLRIGVIDIDQGTGEAQGILTLSQAGNNTIDADSILIGDTKWAYNWVGVDHAMHLGGASNIIHTDSLTVGGRKADATLDIVLGGTLDLSGRTGAKTDLFVGDCNAPGTGATVSSVMDLSNATLNATLGQVVLGRYHSGPGYSTGALIIDGGTITADSILLADVVSPGGTAHPENTHGTVTLRGGTLTVGTVAKGEGQAFFNFEGGTLQIGTFGFTLEQKGGILAPGTSPGYARIEGDYLLNAGILEIEANDAADQGDLLPLPPPSDNNIGFDYLEVLGTATLDSVLQFVLLDGYAPPIGTTFDVLSASEIVIGENFALDQSGAGLPAGANDFAWSIYREGNREFLRLQVVPEPTTFVLIALGVAPLLRRRRKA